ncbi:MAG: hypothetical protein Q4F79_06540 [Eubacteriales bacterium]|nr:hypothetical protein [Eubacteriales bacterium]
MSYIYPLFIRLGLVEHIGSNQRGGPRKGSKRKKSVDNNNGEQQNRWSADAALMA